MKEQLTLLSYILIFAFILRHTMNTGVVDGTIMLLLAPFIVSAAISTAAGWRKILRDGGERDD